MESDVSPTDHCENNYNNRSKLKQYQEKSVKRTWHTLRNVFLYTICFFGVITCTLKFAYIVLNVRIVFCLPNVIKLLIP